MEEIIMVGYGGHAKSIADCIERGKQYHIVGYTDIQETEAPYAYLGTDDILESCFLRGILNAVIGIGYLGKGELRQKLYRRLKDIGFRFPVISDPSAIISENAQIGEGTFVGKGTIINAEAYVGKMCIINSAAVVEHECKVGDFSHIAVGAVLCGQVSLGEAAFIGAGATIIQGQKISAHQIIGAGMTIRGCENEGMVWKRHI